MLGLFVGLVFGWFAPSSAFAADPAAPPSAQKQVESGKIDAGTRGEVTGGPQMGALEVLVSDILCEAGLKKLDVRTRTALELPGYFRATKK